MSWKKDVDGRHFIERADGTRQYISDDVGTAVVWYTPEEYGAVGDGIHDDLAAFQAMHDDIPETGGKVYLSGHYWLSDVWRIYKPLVVEGIAGNRSATPPTLLEGAPGREAVVALDIAGLLGATTSARCAVLRGLSIYSRAMVHPTANGTSDGATAVACINKEWSNGGTVRKGDVYIATGGATNTKCFRCTDTGAGDDAGTFSTPEPSWNTTVGGTTNHNGMTFTTERILNTTEHQTSTAYAVGDRVIAPDDNRYVFECTASSGNSAGSRPSQLAGGISGGTSGVQVLEDITDGNVTWEAKLMCGVYANGCPLGRIENCELQGFTTYALHMQGGTSQDDRVAATNVDNFKIRDCYIQHSGGGIYIAGDDANGYAIDAPIIDSIGLFMPHPYTSSVSECGEGGHAIGEASQVGGTISNMYIQNCTGRPVYKISNSSKVILLNCFNESVVGSEGFSDSEQVIIIGGNLPFTISSTGLTHIDRVKGRGLVEKYTASFPGATESTGGQARMSAAPSNYPGFYRFQADNAVGFWSLSYGAVPGGGCQGYWSMRHQDASPNVAYLLSTENAASSLDPGPGWLIFPNGFFVGDPSVSIAEVLYRGPLSKITYAQIRQGKRRQGDQFFDQDVTYTMTSDGYRGPVWTANTAVSTGLSAYGIPASMIEPTTNTPNEGNPAGGEPVFKCTTAGTTHSTNEPNWASAPNVNDTVAEDSPSTVVWTNVGNTPTWT